MVEEEEELWEESKVLDRHGEWFISCVEEELLQLVFE